jgi:hypothetical protein
LPSATASNTTTSGTSSGTITPSAAVSSATGTVVATSSEGSGAHMYPLKEAILAAFLANVIILYILITPP